MIRKRTKVAKQAQTLLMWLESLELPARIINALRRDLEVVTGERQDERGSMLAGFDQARFTEELYCPRGGQVAKVPAVAASAIEALRAVIPAPVSTDAVETSQEVQSEEAADAVTERIKAQSDEMVAHAIPESTETLEEVTAPEVVDTTTKRRRQPPRDEVASEVAVAVPARTHRARVVALHDATQQVPATVAPSANTLTSLLAEQQVALPEEEPSFNVLLRLWRELHPQGRRAAMHFMADLLVE